MKLLKNSYFLILLFSICLPIGLLAQGGWFQYYNEDVGDNLNIGMQTIDVVEPTFDGGYIGVGIGVGNVGWTYDNCARIIKTDQWGNEQWTTCIVGGQFTELENTPRSFDVVVTPNNEYLLAFLMQGFDGVVDSMNITIQLVKLNASGEVITSTLVKDFEGYLPNGSLFYNPNSLKFSATNDGNYIIYTVAPEICSIGDCKGTYYLTKITEEGEQLWENELPFSHPYGAFCALYDIQAAPNGGYVFTRYVGAYDDTDCFELVLVDEEGNLVWVYEDYLELPEEYHFEHLYPTIDFNSVGNILIGMNYEVAPLEYKHPFICEVDYTDGTNEKIFDIATVDGMDIGVENFYEGFCVKENDHIVLSSYKKDTTLKAAIEDFVSIQMSEINGSGFLVESHAYTLFNSQQLLLDDPNEIYHYSIGQIIVNEDQSFVLGGRATMYQEDLESSIVQVPYLLKVDASYQLYSSQICGTLFEDENQNCVKDGNEMGLAGRVVTLQPGNRFALTDSFGNYCFDVNEGIYTLSTSLKDDSLWTSECALNGINFIVENEEVLNGINLGYYAEYECTLLEVSLGTSLLRRCFENVYTVQYCNKGGMATDTASVLVTFDHYIQVNDASMPYQDLGNNEFLFDLGFVGVGECGSFNIVTMPDCDAPLEATACAVAQIYPAEFCQEISEYWDGSDITLEVSCLGDSVEFLLRNRGENMLEPRGYLMYEDDLIERIGDFQLAEEEELIVRHPIENGATYTLLAEEHEFSPEIGNEIISIEMCGNGPHSTGFITSMQQGDEEAFIDKDCRQIIGSYDPNDKLIVPSGVGAENYVNANDELEYTIRFQNTGNDTAFTVYILDTLSSLLDIQSFRNGVSSHDYTLEIIEDSILRWQFDDIYLPDSNVNEVASHGFVKFFISPQSTIEQGSVITNTAGIYFDFNPPVLTPEIFVTVCDECVWQQKTRYLHSKIFLEGAYNESTGEMNTGLNEYIPTIQTYRGLPYIYYGGEHLEVVPDNMVDWVLVELREGTPQMIGTQGTQVIESRAGILLNDGKIVDLDGESPLAFNKTISENDYYFCIRHRNHLDVLSAYPTMAADDMYYDFTLSENQAFGVQQLKESEDGIYMLYAGDYNGDGIIQLTDFDVWIENPAVLDTYENADGNLDGVIQLTDFDEWRKNKAKIGSVEIGF